MKPVAFLTSDLCPLSDADNGTPNYQNATALIVTFTVNNHLDDEKNQYAKIWEAEFLHRIKNAKLTHTNVSYSAEVSERSR